MHEGRSSLSHVICLHVAYLGIFRGLQPAGLHPHILALGAHLTALRGGGRGGGGRKVSREVTVEWEGKGGAKVGEGGGGEGCGRQVR